MILLERYELLKAHGDHSISVGFGSYGQVKLALDKKTGRHVAVKIVNKLAKNEVVFHQQLYHPNIIQLLGYFIDKEKETTYMILEYADGGTLFEKVRNENLNKKQIKKYFKDVCEAVAYMHSNDIMHRDIKPQNILLTQKGQAKLCDFGFAAILGQRKTLCGTYQYMSPQMVQNRPYDYKIDIWALGILLFELIAGRAPFKGNSPQEVLDQMKTKIFFGDRFTSEQIDLIKIILRVTPSKRPSIKQILDHSYFQQDEDNSTKQSQIQQKQFKNDMSIKGMLTNTVSPINMPKAQHNSYPFYVPKVNHYQQVNIPTKMPEQFQKQPNTVTYSPITMPKNISPTIYDYKPGGFGTNGNLNNSFSNIVNQHRKS